MVSQGGGPKKQHLDLPLNRLRPRQGSLSAGERADSELRPPLSADAKSDKPRQPCSRYSKYVRRDGPLGYLTGARFLACCTSTPRSTLRDTVLKVQHFRLCRTLRLEKPGWEAKRPFGHAFQLSPPSLMFIGARLGLASPTPFGPDISKNWMPQ
jgi:hypothetical protein